MNTLVKNNNDFRTIFYFNDSLLYKIIDIDNNENIIGEYNHGIYIGYNKNKSINYKEYILFDKNGYININKCKNLPYKIYYYEDGLKSSEWYNIEKESSDPIAIFYNSKGEIFKKIYKNDYDTILNLNI